MSRQWPEAIRRRKVAEALRLYARLLVEHERVRRLRKGPSPAAARWCRPAPQVWRPLHEVALFQGMGPRAAVLSLFCSKFPDGEVGQKVPRAGLHALPSGPDGEVRAKAPRGGEQAATDRLMADAVPERVPCPEYQEALRIAVERAGDAIVQNGGEPPWGTAEARAPESADAFEAICRELRDRDADAAEFGSLAAILDSADLRAVPPAAHRVVFDAGEYVLAIDGVAIALPEGQERDFFRSLIAASKVGRVTPVVEHDRVWKGAVDRLRERIRKAMGRSLLREVVLTAKGRTGGYRLNPNVEIRFASEIGLRFISEDVIDTIAHPVRGRGRKSGPSRDE